MSSLCLSLSPFVITLKSIPMVAVALSGSNTSSQYLVNTAPGVSQVSFVLFFFLSSSAIQRTISDVRALLPAPDGPMSSSFSVGSLDAMFRSQVRAHEGSNGSNEYEKYR